MISEKQASAQTLRLSGLPGYPGTSQGEKELIRTMRETAQDPAHADRMVRAWQQKSRFAPAPYDLYEIGRETMRSAAQEPHRNCKLCDGTGWRPIWVLRTWMGGDRYAHVSNERISEERYRELRPKVAGLGVQEVYTAVERCGCICSDMQGGGD